MLRSLTKLLRAPFIESFYSNASTWKFNQIGAVTIASNNFHITSNLQKTPEFRGSMAALQKVDEGTDGEVHVHIDSMTTEGDIFPDEHTNTRLFSGVPFNEIPIVNICVTHNNTVITVTDYKGVLKMLHSCGREGFKNARKGTNIAAQATAISFSAKILEMGYKMVRVRVRGMGPGRMSSIKGLQMGGLNIVSVTDSTRVTWYPLRPRKARRL